MRALLLSVLLGCTGEPKQLPEETLDSADPVDADDDGYAAGEDCDDGDSAIHPGATEVCDGVDNDCDSATDEDVSVTYYGDGDDDGFGDAADPIAACSQPAGFVPVGNDCDDDHSAIHPGATEVCDDLDNDCDGDTDEDAIDTFYADDDGDGYGDPATEVTACELPEDHVMNGEDCDDADPSAYPGAAEVCDGADDNCDGDIDEGAGDSSTYYADGDGDGFGGGFTLVACAAPEGYAEAGGDCDDADKGIHPGAAETCDGADEDCDGAVDDGATDPVPWYKDGDGDGYGVTSSALTTCTPPSGYVASGGDCDDADAKSYPAAIEYCDGEDDDCDGVTDEATAADATAWYDDDDGDGYGDPADSTLACSAPAGYTSDRDDCDDGNALVHPGATEICNGADDDCDADTDDDDSSLDASTADAWYRDEDADTYGDPSDTATACAAPAGYVGDDEDCDDTEPDVNPGAAEDCDALDNDCSGLVDDGDACPCDVEWEGDSTYLFCDDDQTWTIARELCGDYGYHLVTVSDATEQAWLASVTGGYSTPYWWLGAADEIVEAIWGWEGGGTWGYTAWCSGEPNNSHGGECSSTTQEDCSAMWGDSGCWNDLPCDCSWSGKLAFICEIEG